MDPDLSSIHETEAELEANLRSRIKAEQVVNELTNVEVVVESIERAAKPVGQAKGKLVSRKLAGCGHADDGEVRLGRIGGRPRKLRLDRRRATQKKSSAQTRRPPPAQRATAAALTH